MKMNVLFFTQEEFKINQPIVYPGNFIYLKDSEDLHRTLGFQLDDKTIRWIPLEMEEIEDGSGTEEDTGTPGEQSGFGGDGLAAGGSGAGA